MKKLAFLLTFALVLAFAGAVSAGTVVETWGKALATTNWSVLASINQYNPAAHGGQALASVLIELWSHGDIDAQMENTSTTEPSTVQVIMTMLVRLDVPANGVPPPWDLITNPNNSGPVHSFSIFDTIKDYGGTSGAIDYTDDSDYGFWSSTAAGILAYFTGAGTVNLPVDATDMTYLSRSGGTLDSVITGSAMADVKVTYTYGEPVPEPGTLLLIGSGLAGLAGYSRMRFGRKK